MRFGSVCSGIEAASVAFGPLGWAGAWFAEIEPFPCAVLAHHYPAVPNLGDMLALPGRIAAREVEAPDVLCGGTPCQAFSVAGLRKSLDDARGNLSLTFCEIANAIDDARQPDRPPAVILWENVPGVLSTADNAFGCFLAGLAGEDDALQPAGGKWSNAGAVYGPRRTVAWRTLDAQYFGLAQRRRRVFVVASARDDFDPVAVLFEFEGVRRDTAPRRETGQNVAAGALRSTDGGCDVDHARAHHLTTHRLRAEGFDASEDGTGRGTPLVPVIVGPLTASSGPRAHGGAGLTTNQAAEAGHVLAAFGGNNTGGPVEVAAGLNAKGGAGRMDFDSETFVTVFDTTQITSPANVSNPQQGDPCHPLAVGQHAPLLTVGFSSKDFGADATTELSPTLRASGSAKNHANGGAPPAVAFQPSPCVGFAWQAGGNGTSSGAFVAEGSPTLQKSQTMAVQHAMQVRRLTPRECERLQGFPDDYTLIPHRGKPAADGHRYKAIGNSWAVPCVRWIGARIQNEVQA